MGFLEEIEEQSAALRGLIDYYSGEGDELLYQAQRMAFKPPRSFVFTGMGSSDFVSEGISVYLGDRSASPVTRWEAGELLHYGLKTVRDNDLIVAISQSGESVETRQVASALRRHGQLLSITNNPDSEIARCARIHLPIVAGQEMTISTKTYTNSLALLLLLSRAFVGEDWTPMSDQIKKTADHIDAFLDTRRPEIDRAADMMADAKVVYCVSRGPAMTAARFGSLIIMEGTHTPAAPIQGGNMRHGPYEAVSDDWHAILFAPNDEGGALVRKMAAEMAGMGCQTLLFTAIDVPETSNLIRIMIEPGDPELFPIACAVPQELLVARMAVDLGLTPGEFIRGGKITTTE